MPNWNVLTSSCDGFTSHFDCVVTLNGVAQQGSYDIRQIDCDPFMKRLRSVIYDRQAAVADELIRGPFSEESVRVKLDRWRAQIADAMEEDALVDKSQWQESVDALLDDLPNFQGSLSLMMSGLIGDQSFE